MKIFLDVGAHNGQTLKQVIKSIYNFDKIFCFEPMPEQFKHLQEIAKNFNNVSVYNFGLSNKNGIFTIYGDNTDQGASIFPRKDINGAHIKTDCQLIKASDFFHNNISDKDIVFMKLNCEGSEVDILEDLAETKEIFKIRNVMIDFDIRKIDNNQYREQNILKKFQEINFTNYSLCEEIMLGSKHGLRINHWLSKYI
jgi:FkbM family methyltransferase